MAVSVVMAGESHEISIVLFDQESGTEYETYRICFDETITKDESRKPELERELRNLVLSVQALEGLKCQRWPPETTFNIMILLSSRVKTSAALSEALREGTWFSPGDESAESLGQRRPIHEMATFGCRLYSEVKTKP
jgi:hypothetical protein